MLDITGDVIWHGSKPVARINPTLGASERDAVERELNPDPTTLEEDFTYQEVKEILGKIEVRAAAIAQAGNVTIAELKSILERLYEEIE